MPSPHSASHPPSVHSVQAPPPPVHSVQAGPLCLPTITSRNAKERAGHGGEPGPSLWSPLHLSQPQLCTRPTAAWSCCEQDQQTIGGSQHHLWGERCQSQNIIFNKSCLPREDLNTPGTLKEISGQFFLIKAVLSYTITLPNTALNWVK